MFCSETDNNFNLLRSQLESTKKKTLRNVDFFLFLKQILKIEQIYCLQGEKKSE